MERRERNYFSKKININYKSVTILLSLPFYFICRLTSERAENWLPSVNNFGPQHCGGMGYESNFQEWIRNSGLTSHGPSRCLIHFGNETWGTDVKCNGPLVAFSGLFEFTTSVTLTSQLHANQLKPALASRHIYLNELKLVICFDNQQELFSSNPGNEHNNHSNKGYNLPLWIAPLTLNHLPVTLVIDPSKSKPRVFLKNVKIWQLRAYRRIRNAWFIHKEVHGAEIHAIRTKV